MQHTEQTQHSHSPEGSGQEANILSSTTLPIVHGSLTFLFAMHENARDLTWTALKMKHAIAHARKTERCFLIVEHGAPFTVPLFCSEAEIFFAEALKKERKKSPDRTDLERWRETIFQDPLPGIFGPTLLGPFMQGNKVVAPFSKPFAIVPSTKVSGGNDYSANLARIFVDCRSMHSKLCLLSEVPIFEGYVHFFRSNLASELAAKTTGEEHLKYMGLWIKHYELSSKIRDEGVIGQVASIFAREPKASVIVVRGANHEISLTRAAARSKCTFLMERQGHSAAAALTNVDSDPEHWDDAYVRKIALRASFLESLQVAKSVNNKGQADEYLKRTTQIDAHLDAMGRDALHSWFAEPPIASVSLAQRIVLTRAWFRQRIGEPAWLELGLGA